MAGHYHRSKDCFQYIGLYSKIPYLNQATPKKGIRQIFLPNKIPEFKNI